MKKLLYILSFLLSLGLFAQNEALFEQANALYNDAKYGEAIDKYKTILDTKNHSAELYFNLGNAHYKLNNIAPSIYYYEKALQLAPNDEDIKNNLAFAQNMTIDAIDVVPEAGLSKILNNAANTMTFDGWAKTAIVFVFCFVVLFLIYYFAYSSLRKRLTFIGSLVSLVLMCITLLFAFHKFNLDKRDKPAIVFVKEILVKNAPNNRSEESFRLHEGTKVQVLDTVDNWKKIKLQDGKTGWVSSEDLKAL
ncbi:tetratricopeptide repeat protein [Mariniflexile litorale]|uniref:Tetratricopeptide repeat protein n=1 Tax=Mariniflexile litorale TaxID=3045158 RepID=A0AAU7EK67_9FLAO|nr:tetratricopeptide repeat protein [Mariniflexile sp. KMM 9835]MDQ8213226.1 tetratricopeptide repeat protein [Mariniflexile sp. KMM 9835]